MLPESVRKQKKIRSKRLVKKKKSSLIESPFKPLSHSTGLNKGGSPSSSPIIEAKKPVEKPRQVIEPIRDTISVPEVNRGLEPTSGFSGVVNNGLFKNNHSSGIAAMSPQGGGVQKHTFSNPLQPIEGEYEYEYEYED